MARVAFRNFTGGEVTPALSARYDLKKAGSFLQCCENFIPNMHGDIERRPGTVFVADLGAESVLIPFQFNTDPDNNYVLVFQAGCIRIATATGMESAVLDNPYTLSEVYEISYAQVGDIIYMAHVAHPLHKIMRSGSAGAYEWAIEEVVLNQSIDPPSEAPTVEWHRGPKSSSDDSEYTQNETYDLNYKVSAVDENGVESLPSEEGTVVGRYPTDWVSGDYVLLTWPAVEGAVEYNVYRDSAGYYGLIGVVDGENVEGATVTGLSVGNSEASVVNFSGRMTKTAVNYNGRPGYTDSETTSDLSVIVDTSQNAFTFDGNMLVYVTCTTTTTQWDYNSDDGWTSSTRTTTDYSWVMVAGTSAGTYTTYTEGSLGTRSSAPSGTVGVYTVKPIYSGGGTLTFKDENFEADTSTTPKEDWNPFEDGNNPSVVCFHQQRMVLACTRDNPASFYMSRTGDFENFRRSRPVQDDDPVEYMLASGSVDDIKWIASFGDLLIGTSGAEYDATSSGAAITPSDVTISSQSYWGSTGIKPLIIGTSVLHCQRAGSHVRDLAYSWEQDGYTGNDLSILAPNEVEGHGIKQWAFQQTPGNNVWAVREDGVLLCLTYMKEQEVYGWSRHITDGTFTSVAGLCGRDEDVVMVVARREIDGVGHYFLERFAERFKDTDELEDAFYVDAGITQTFDEEVSEVGGLSHLEGKSVVVLADGGPEEGHVVLDGKISLYFPAKKVTVGLNYSSVLMPLPIETDMDSGATLTKRRAYGKCILRLYRTVGGKYAATEDGDLFKSEAWKERTFYELPFLPDYFGRACEPYSGDLEISLPSGQDTDTSILVLQDRPTPFRLVALAVDVEFGEL